ncbi:MAG: FGGY-family carbohydrate kinase [Bauldia sp.]
MAEIFAGIDVGTGSARAGLFNAQGVLLGSAKRAIEIWREAGDIVEQSSDDIWEACAGALRAALAEAAVKASDVGGIGFDATCSLVVLDAAGAPLSVSPSDDPRRNVVVWMDHRAVAEARAIDETNDDVLRYVGGTISPEMEMPKLLWLKRHRPKTFAGAGHFLDLADYLSWRATGSLARSSCTVTCKWTYLAHESRWSDTFLAAIGLNELSEDSHRRIGQTIVPPGTPLASGLTAAAARDLGLDPGTPVAAGLIDAHAGALGTLGGRATDGAPGDPTQRLGYIMGTSSCIMASTAAPTFVPGVWGPYYSAVVPGLWLNEGGQSTAGAALDHLVRSHVAYPRVAAEAKAAGREPLDYLEARIVRRMNRLSDAARLAGERHVLPDFLGNRSPYADPDTRAAIVGLSMDDTVEDLEIHFVAGLCGIAYGLAEVVDALGANGIASHRIVASGGASHSRLVRQILADATGQVVVLPETAEPVLLGAAMLGALAARRYATFEAAMAAMSSDGIATAPTPADVADFHSRKRSVHRMLRQMESEAREAMTYAL